jgi:hypothetical protein
MDMCTFYIYLGLLWVQTAVTSAIGLYEYFSQNSVIKTRDASLCFGGRKFEIKLAVHCLAMTTFTGVSNSARKSHLYQTKGKKKANN